MNTSLINCNRGKKRTRDNHFKDDETNKETHKEIEKALVPLLDENCIDLIKKYHDFTMADRRSMVGQICDLQAIVRELEESKIPLVEKYQIGMLMAKLPPSWRDFTTPLRNSQEKMSMNVLIAAIEIEENAWAENLKSMLEKLNSTSNGMDLGACWACRKMGYITDNCMRRKKMIRKMNLVESQYESQIKFSKTKFQNRKKMRQITTKHAKKIKKSKERVIGACWACRKIGYLTDNCSHRRNIIQKARTICSPQTNCNHLHFLE